MMIIQTITHFLEFEHTDLQRPLANNCNRPWIGLGPSTKRAPTFSGSKISPSLYIEFSCDLNVILRVGLPCKLIKSKSACGINWMIQLTVNLK